MAYKQMWNGVKPKSDSGKVPVSLRSGPILTILDGWQSASALVRVQSDFRTGGSGMRVVFEPNSDSLRQEQIQEFISEAAGSRHCGLNASVRGEVLNRGVVRAFSLWLLIL